MILIVGLGNPGKKFQKTRHNLGFRVVDKLRFLKDKKIILAKPQTFMNLSGKAVKSLMTKYKVPPLNLWVIHDDIDLPLGKIRISKGRGAAGHKGVESIIEELKTKNFIRLRIGIQPTAAVEKPSTRAKLGAGLVLQKFNKDEERIVKKIIKKSAEAIEFALTQGIEKTMSRYNK